MDDQAPNSTEPESPIRRFPVIKAVIMAAASGTDPPKSKPPDSLDGGAARPRRSSPPPNNRGFRYIIPASVVGAISLAVFQHQIDGLPRLTNWIAALAEDLPHEYRFQDGDKLVKGESTSKFIGGENFRARIEYCLQFATDASRAVVTNCYITVKTSSPIVITNTRNTTTARFSNGYRAPVCCMTINNNGPHATHPAPGFPGTTYQRTFEADQTVQVIMTIPSLQSDLDVIEFSPGNRGDSVILPVSDYVTRRFITRQMVSRLGEVELREFVEDAHRQEINIRESERRNAELFGY